MGETDCEALGAGWLAQPAGAWSSLAYVVAALVVARRSPRAAVLLALVGIGSFAFHGPQPGWAGAGHDGSIAGLLVVLAGGGLVLAVAAAAVAPFAAVPVHAVLAAVVGWRRRDHLPVVLLAAGATCLVLGRTGGPLCEPDSLLQAHAAWHVLSAAAAARLATSG